jgi:quinoprotein relay system zinc metallohydrolase 1
VALELTGAGMSSSIIDRRAALVRMGATAALAALPAFDLAAAPRAYTLAPRRLTDGVWMVAGAQEAITEANGGAIANITIFDTTDGAVLVDCGPSLKYGRALIDVVRTLTGKPVARVYLTHFHPDHVFGAQAFAAGVVAATPGVVAGLTQMGEDFSAAMYRTAGDWMRGTELVLPTTLVERPTEEIGGRRFRLLRMKGHTASDLVVYDERTGIMVAGDLVFLDRAPTTPHATLADWRIALATLGGIPHTMLVPGHGPAEEASNRGTEQTRRWLEAIERLVGDAFERGLDITEAAALPLPTWTDGIALARYELERSVAHLYPALEAGRLPRVGGVQ